MIGPGDPGYPDVLRGKSDTTLYLRGEIAALNGPTVAILPSIKPSDREVQGLVACVKGLADPNIRVLVGYSPKGDCPVIWTALEQGTYVIICLVEGILQFRVRRDLQDLWDEDRMSVISSAVAPN